MKLVTPEFSVDEGYPFKGDCFNRRDLATSLLKLIQNTNESLVLSINAEWGEGKSTFLQMWMKELENSNENTNLGCIYFDAFAHDYLDDPFMDIVCHVINFIETEFNEKVPEGFEVENRRLLSEKAMALKSCAIDIAKVAFKSSLTVGLKTITNKIVGKDEVDALVEIKDKISDTFEDKSSIFSDELLTNYLTEKINNNQNQKLALVEFTNTLSAIGQVLSDIFGLPLIIIIDELDRCRPSYAVEVLEKIKHLFSAENVVFILAINKTQLEESIKTIYGEIDAKKYLQKFINIECELTKSQKNMEIRDYEKIVQSLAFKHGLDEQEYTASLIGSTQLFAKHYELSPRDLSKIFTNYVLFFRSNPNYRLSLIPLIVFISIIKVIKSNVFIAMQQKKVSLSSLKKDAELIGFFVKSPNGLTKKNNEYMQHFRYLLEICFQSKKDFPSQDHSYLHNTYREFANQFNERSDIISDLCNKLNMFNYL